MQFVTSFKSPVTNIFVWTLPVNTATQNMV